MRGLENVTDPACARFQLTQKFKDLLEEQFSATEELDPQIRTPAQFATQLRVHPNHLNATVKYTTGKTIRELIKDRTITEARILLKHTDKQITEISYQLGFKEPASFIHFFKKSTGITPLNFRKQVL
jgi:AraC-like DNA-binding protein